MKITLINTTNLISNDGAHLISALLKRAGHTVKNVQLSRRRQINLRYEPSEFEQLHEIIKDTELVMVAVYSSYAIHAIQVTDFIHKKYPGMKVIWGGAHCISAPELSLRHADGVCFAEGDIAIVDFVRKIESCSDYTNIPNMAFNLNGSCKINDTLPPFSDLDSLPCYDYSVDDHFLLDNKLLPMTKEKYKEHYVKYPFNSPTLTLITSRGCPFACTYCNNIRYINMYGHTPIRFQSINRVIDELECAIENFDFFQYVAFGDDDFLLRDQKQLLAFSEKYTKNIGLPFGICVNANTFHKEKMEILLNAGLKVIQMGIQSGSQRILDEVFDRKTKLAKTKEIISQIAPYCKSHGLKLLLDFIIDNPYETRDDIIQTYKFIINLPPEIDFNIFYLSFFPGTPIYNRALKDKIIEPFNEDTVLFSRKRVIYQRNYETAIILLTKFLRNHMKLWQYTPRFALHMLGSKTIRRIVSPFSSLTFKFLTGIIRCARYFITLTRFLKSLLYQ